MKNRENRKLWNSIGKRTAASLLAGTLALTGGFAAPSVKAYAAENEKAAETANTQETDAEKSLQILETPGCTWQDGNNIYYAYEMNGVRMGLMKFNTKTGKKKQVVSYKNGKKETNGFSQISGDGKYLYATWDRAYGTLYSQDYIYRISKDGKSVKKLAEGYSPLLVNDRIYYVSTKLKTEPQEEFRYSDNTGYVMSMKKDGTDKKKVKKIGGKGDGKEYTLFCSGSQIYYTKNFKHNKFYTLDGKACDRADFAVKDDQYTTLAAPVVSDGTYSYQTTGDRDGIPTKLYRVDNVTGKKNVVASFPRGIMRYTVTGEYVFVEAFIPATGKNKLSNEKLSVYCIKADGSKKTKLASWYAGE